MSAAAVLRLLLLLVAAVMGQPCNVPARMNCTTDVGICAMNAGAHHDRQCNCIQTYIECSNATHCLTPHELAADLDACDTLQCPCPSGGLPPSPPTPLPSVCNSTFFGDCSLDFTECESAAGNSTLSMCKCFPKYISNCLIGSGCASNTAVGNVENACRTLGCATAQCQGQTICDPSAAAACARTLRQCAMKAPNHDGICKCYIAYLPCVKATNCLTQAQYQAQVQACENAMCVGCNSTLTWFE